MTKVICDVCLATNTLSDDYEESNWVCYSCKTVHPATKVKESVPVEFRIEFEQVKTNIAMNLWRAKVPGGWLISSSDDVLTNVPEQNLFGAGYEWRNSICFLPDPDHKWGKQEENRSCLNCDWRVAQYGERNETQCGCDGSYNPPDYKCSKWGSRRDKNNG